MAICLAAFMDFTWDCYEWLIRTRQATWNDLTNLQDRNGASASQARDSMQCRKETFCPTIPGMRNW